MDFSWFKNFIENVTIKLGFSKVNSPTTKTTYKAELQQVNNFGMTVTEVKDLVNVLLENQLSTLKSEAQATFNARVNDFKSIVISKLGTLQPDELKTLREPDAQLGLVEASQISGQKNSSELRELLANLVIKRAKNDPEDNEELKNVIFREAVSVVGKLTTNQLKIVTLAYIFRYARFSQIVTPPYLSKALFDEVKSLIDFRNSNSDFQHIQYTGCGNLDTFPVKFARIMKAHYPYLFLKPITQQQYDELKLEDNVKSLIFLPSSTVGEYNFIPIMKAELETSLNDRNVPHDQLSEILNLFENNKLADNQVDALIKEQMPSLAPLYEIWDNTDINKLSLNSVGIAIGITYYEQISGETLDVNIWIK